MTWAQTLVNWALFLVAMAALGVLVNAPNVGPVAGWGAAAALVLALVAWWFGE